jgi:hypothetical protein
MFSQVALKLILTFKKRFNVAGAQARKIDGDYVGQHLAVDVVLAGHLLHGGWRVQIGHDEVVGLG